MIICCPNFNSLLRLIFKGKWYPLSMPHHLVHFTPKTLSQILQVSGYTVKHRKKHFVDPLTNMGSLKMSLLRFLGLGRMTGLSLHGETAKEKHGYRPVWWSIARFGFNATAFIISLVLSMVGNEDVILVWAVKYQK